MSRAFCVLAVTLGGPAFAQANEVFLVQSVFDLAVATPIPNPTDFRPDPRWLSRARALFPYAVVDGAEVYVTSSKNSLRTRLEDMRISVRSTANAPIKGTLYWPDNAGERMLRIPFRVDMSKATEGQRTQFLQEKLRHYERLLDEDGPGTAWFRHLARTVRKQLGNANTRTTLRSFFGRRHNGMSDTFALLAGVRSLSENLNLDQILPLNSDANANVSLTALQGISTKQYDWTPLLNNAAPVADPLAKVIPEDQYAFLFSSLDAMANMADGASRHGVPILNVAEPRAENAKTRQRYERQLGVTLRDNSGAIAALVQSVALTSSDPYFRTGTDVALLFQTSDTVQLKQLLDAQIAGVADRFKQTHVESGELGGVPFEAVRTKDRRLCSYRAVLGSAVVVTNSPAQFKKLAETLNGTRSSVASTPEYVYFRDRYKQGATETALLVVPEKALQRLGSPRWRVGSSRRVRALALMAEAQARRIDGLGTQTADSQNSVPLKDLPGLDDVTVRPDGVESEQFGTLEFQTPIAEMKVDSVTIAEARSYKQWRRRHQQTVGEYLEPFAVQFLVSNNETTADITIRPFIPRPNHQMFLAFSQGSKVGENGGDPHIGALVHLSIALNRLAPITRLLTSFGPPEANPFMWIGDTLAVYADQGEFFTGLIDVEPEELANYVRLNLHKLPVALHVDVRDAAQLKVYLDRLRTLADRRAPGIAVWEERTYNGHKYTRVGPSEQLSEQVGNMALFFATGTDSLVVSLSETVVQESIERRESRLEAAGGEGDWTRPGKPWIGDNLNVQVDSALLSYYEKPLRSFYQQSMQVLSWKNIAILNEWQRRHPDQDPVAVHESYWQRQLLCPGGGKYRWNEEWQTMESTVFGHPGQPKMGPTWPRSLSRLSHSNFGVSLEAGGLRIRASLLWK